MNEKLNLCLWMEKDEVEALKKVNEGGASNHPIVRQAKSQIILNRIYQDWLNMFGRITELENHMKDDALLDHEIQMSMKEYLHSLEIVEELRLLADSMSTHKALADKIGISPQYLHDVIRGRREPGPKVLKFLKVKRVTMYVEDK